MAYDFGNLAAPVKSDKKYDFGGLSTPKNTIQVKDVPEDVPTDENIKKSMARADNYRMQEEPPDNLLGKITGAVYETPVSLATSAVLAPIAAAYGLTGGKDVKEQNRRIDKVMQYAYRPVTTTGKHLTQKVGDFVQDSGVMGIPMGEVGMLSEGVSQASPAIREGMSIAGKPIVSAAESVKKIPMAFKPDPQTLSLARKAQDLGIPLRPDMLTDNKIMRSIGEALESVPLSGSKAGARQEAFNRALINQIGGDKTAKKLTPDVFEGAIRRSGTEIGSISRKNPVKVDDSFSSGLDKVVADSSKFETSENSRIIQNYVTEIKGKIKDGVLDGTTFRKLDSAIGRKIRSTQDGDLRSALGDIQESMREALNRSLPDDATRKALQSSRTKYAKAMSIEPLVAKSKTGDISPAGLMGRVTSDRAGKSRMARGQGGDMGDLAKIGQAFIKEQPSSGTAERTLGYGALGGLAGGAAFTHPLATGSVYGMANLYNRLGPLLIPDVPGK